MVVPARFSFDRAKDAINRGKHHISLERAADFNFATALFGIDDRRDYGEVREVAFGFVEQRLHVLVFTMRDDTCHVISLRKANRREVRKYVDQI